MLIYKIIYIIMYLNSAINGHGLTLTWDVFKLRPIPKGIKTSHKFNFNMRCI